MASPNDRRYSRDHEWVKVDGDTAVVGITDYAQEQLGDVVYLDLPQPGGMLAQFEKMGEIESVKAVSDLFAPVSGEVLRTNDAVVERPELVNSDPHGEGWMVLIRLVDASELARLLSAGEYDALIDAEARDEALRP